MLLAILVQSSSQLWTEAVFYLNRDYIAKELCVNRFDLIPTCKGSCVLEKKLKEDADKANTPQIRQMDVIFFYVARISVIPPETYSDPAPKLPILNTRIRTYSYLKGIFRPPCIVV